MRLHCKSLIMVGAFVLILMGAIASIASGEDMTTAVVIMDNVKLRSFSIVGAVLGAVLSVSVLMGRDATTRNVLMQFSGATIAGVVFTPMFLRYWAVGLDTDSVLGGAALVAMLSTITLHKLVPFYERWLDRKLDGLTNKE